MPKWTRHTHTHSLSLYPAVYLFIQVLLESCASLYYKIGLGQIYWSIYDTAYYVTFGKKGNGAREIRVQEFWVKNDMTKFVGRAIALARKKNTCKKRFKKLTSFEERGKRPVCIRSSCLFVRVVKDHTILLLRHVGCTFVQVVGLLLRYSRSCCRIRSLRRFVIGIRLDGTG